MARRRIGVVGDEVQTMWALYATCLIEKFCPQYVLNLIIIFFKTYKEIQINKERFTFS